MLMGLIISGSNMLTICLFWKVQTYYVFAISIILNLVNYCKDDYIYFYMYFLDIERCLKTTLKIYD